MSGERKRAQRPTGHGESLAVFAEAMLMGFVVVLASLPLVTAAAACAAAAGHLRRTLRGERGRVREWAGDFRRALAGSWLLSGAVLGAVAVVVVIDRPLLHGAAVPGGPVLSAVLAGCALIGTASLVRAGAGWRPGARWTRTAERAVATAFRPWALVVAGALTCVVLTAGVPPLAAALLGAALLAAVLEETQAEERVAAAVREREGAEHG